MTDLVLGELTKRYGPVTALDRVTLRAQGGRRTVIVGPSGSGKTTLLRLVAGFERPDAGRISLDAAVLAEGARIVPAHRRGVGIVSQDGALFPHLDVAANVAFGLDRRARDGAATVERLMQMVDLDPAMATRRPDQLSGGQQQRVALARALAPGPRLLLLDEAFSALDTGLRASTRRAVMDLLQRTGVTTVLVTHDQEEALSFADHLVVLRQGRVEQAGTPRELYQHPVNEFVARFFGEVVILPARLHGGIAQCALGTVPATHATVDGPGTIMVRSEQIAVVAPSPSAPRARVGAVEFCGSTVALTVSLDDGAAGLPLRLHIPAEQWPAASLTEVSLAVRGPAVALSDT